MAGENSSTETKNQEINEKTPEVQTFETNVEFESSQKVESDTELSADNASIDTDIQSTESTSKEKDQVLLKEAYELLQTQLETTKYQLEEKESQYKRLGADFDNFRKRTQKEKEDLDTQVKCSTIMELLPVIDNFERARSHIKPANDGEMAIHKSYQSVYKQMVDSLKRLGVSVMRPEGQEFDPNLHEAVMREATAEHPEGTVIEELVRGYILGERVLRHAMVKVATAPDTDAETENQTDPES
ncbi:GrpE protein [Trichodesmium erythraeum IMS101]|uniref:Protein GrpE n=1 Tax=Trichodesmium erythraeum (strain IMS101) TaxID=203124 RepID=GRPE_TRIEI|nr:RecName: Full=Protein GrpE; AltName: Full=HSP-70 cofactor [Trichodesmium erythraeum IMS101]MBS9773431.1 nucleotide exchange factor GrpE [Trichodesmium erythraeum GBRTRLIN201]MCH2048942.1 nucleotide exchange factor GrpE [Trichodesmium sp. ALOHA_ZT_67]MDE5095534.1 nucleotide exchange factor GrpE [Trichodesmium sp. St11_bin5]